MYCLIYQYHCSYYDYADDDQNYQSTNLVFLFDFMIFFLLEIFNCKQNVFKEY